jgi:hypothetical protein
MLSVIILSVVAPVSYPKHQQWTHFMSLVWVSSFVFIERLFTKIQLRKILNEILFML